MEMRFDSQVPGEAEEEALSPAEALALVDRQAASSRRELEVNGALIYFVWGVAWLISYGLTFLAYGSGDGPILAMPEWVMPVVWPVSIYSALLVMGVHMVRRRRGIAGASNAAAALYGLGWGIAFAGTFPLALLLRPGDQQDPAYWLYPSVFICVVVGISYLFTAAGEQDRVMYVTGAWILAVNLAGVAAGFGWYTLVLALAGGGGFLVAAAVETIRNRRRR